MGFLKQKPKYSGGLAARKGVHRDYVEEAQRNAGGSHQATDKKDIINQCSGTGQRQNQIQTRLAQIRSEAVLARRLAEQIDNLSQNAPTQTRKQVDMTDSTTTNSGKARGKLRRASDKPRTAKVRSSFNPLHPSMELPPEQLIRLLGLESKKIRKHKRTSTTSAQRTPAPPTAAAPPSKRKRPDTETTTHEKPEATRSTHRQREYEQAKKQGRSKSRRHGLWLPALATGLICGVAVSGYLFWMQPEQSTTTAVAAPVPSKVNRSPVSSAQRKPVTKTAASTAKSKPVPGGKNDPAWQATVKAREKHLRNEAKLRLEQRLKQKAQAASVAAPPITPPESEVVTTGRPVSIITSTRELTSTGSPAVKPETAAHDETPADNPTAGLVTKTVNTSTQAPETQGFQDSSAIELTAEQVPAATSEPTGQLNDENIPSTPAVDAPTQEGAAGLF